MSGPAFRRGAIAFLAGAAAFFAGTAATGFREDLDFGATFFLETEDLRAGAGLWATFLTFLAAFDSGFF